MTLRKISSRRLSRRPIVGGIPTSWIAGLVVGLLRNLAASRHHRRAADPPSTNAWLRRDIGLPPVESDDPWRHHPR